MKRFILSTPFALGMTLFTSNSAAPAKLLCQGQCLVLPLSLGFHNAAKVMGNWGYRAGGEETEKLSITNG